jgi:hypothetical protein
MMAKLTMLSNKGQQLVKMYQNIATSGYDTTLGIRVDSAYNDFELRQFRADIKEIFKEFSIDDVLDYGSGGSDWLERGFDPATGQSAVEYFNLSNALRYEPARGIDQRGTADCVISFDVLEHIFVYDVPNILRDMFSYARKLLLLNISCRPAFAQLPNGENAHVTVRKPMWWKGMVDSIAGEYPKVSVLLMCNETVGGAPGAFPAYSAQMWLDDESFVINY